MGMRSVAVFVDGDADALFVADADEAVRLSTGYLDADGLIEAARRAGADAVHPGYGFLAENAGFAEAVGAAASLGSGSVMLTALPNESLKVIRKTFLVVAAILFPPFLGRSAAFCLLNCSS